MTGRVRQTWWRRERVAIVLLPVILMATIAATSSRIHDYWWMKGFHERASVSDGVARIDTAYDDGFLSYPIRAEVRVESAGPVDRLPDAFAPVTVPTGARLWQVRLGWEADPDIALTGCMVALVDADGNRYDGSIRAYETGAPTSIQTCVPDDTPGPITVFGSTDPPALTPGQQPRPATYSTSAYVVVPDDVRPTGVRVWWVLPDYAELPLS